MDPSNVREQYFIRTAKEDEKTVQEVFGDVIAVSIPEVTDEFAFVTSEMNEREKDAKIEKLAGFRKAIRLLGRFDLDSPEQSAQA